MSKQFSKISTIALILVTILFGQPGITDAATFYFNQTNWSGGATANTAVHPTNQNSWNQYSAKDANLTAANAGADLQLAAQNTSTTHTTDTDFNTGTLTSAVVSSTGAGANVQLTKTATANTWTTMAAMPGISVGGSMTYDGNGNIYASQSSNGSTVTNVFWKYSIASNTWSVMAAMPGASYNGSMTYDGNGNIYANQGYNGSAYTNTFWKYNIASNSWSVMAAMPNTNGVNTLIYDDNGSIFIKQGYTGSTSDATFWKYSIASNTWSAMAAMPDRSYGGGGTYDGNGNIYITQGTSHNVAAATNAFWKYNIASNVWSVMAVLPAISSGPLSYDGNGNIFAKRAYTGSGYSSSFWKYSISSATWSTMTSAPEITGGSEMIYDGNGNIYTKQGSNGSANTNTFWKYSINDNYASSGTYESATIDMGVKSNLSSLTFNPTTTPTASGTMQFQLATSDNSGGPWTYVGPDGTAGTYFTTSGSVPPASLNGKRYARYKAFLTGGGSGWSTMADAPGWVAGGTIQYDNNGNIYALKGNNTTDFWKYSIVSNTWSALAATPIAISNVFSSYDNNGNIYVLRGDNTTDFWKYSIASNTWSVMAAMPGTIIVGAAVYDGNGNIFVNQGNMTTAFWKYSIASNTWSTMAATPSAVNIAGSLAYDGNGNIYALKGNNTTDFWKYSIASNTWSALANAPAILMTSASLEYDNNGNIYALKGNNTTDFWKYSIASNTWSALAATPLSITGSGGSLAYDNVGNLYAYRGWFFQVLFKYSTRTAATPQLSDITLNYSSYPTSQTLTSSAYDSSSAANLISKIQWSASTTAATGAKFQIRTSADNSTWTSWYGPTGTSSYFTAADGSQSVPSIFSDGASDRYIQYQAVLTSDGTASPTLSDVTMTYVVNAPPEFDSAATTTAIQSASSSDANWGKVVINYSVRDSDTTSGTFTPGFVTPSFQYNIGGGWIAIASSSLAAGNADNKIVTTLGFTPYTATWDAASQIPGQYVPSAQIRVTVNDNEAANNTAQATTASFLLDTKDPVISTFTINGTTNELSIAASDNQPFQYVISNNSDGSYDNTNASSGQWSTAATSTTATTSWVLAGAPSNQVTYLIARDIYGNVASTTAVAPTAPIYMDLKDTSNVLINNYQQFISWKAYTATTSAAFNRYEVYRSTDGYSFNLWDTITNPATNYFADSNLASTTTYYYKTLVVDSDGDVSPFSSSVNHMPNGQGGTDSTKPTISLITATDTQSTYAKATFTTNELAFGTVEYHAAGGSPYALSATKDTVATDHSLVLANLDPNTTYTFRVKAVDIAGNTTTDDNAGAGYTFTTRGGPIITDVTTTLTDDKNAVVVWNTNKDSDSSLIYATNIPALVSGIGATNINDVTFVGGAGPLYQHKIILTGLSPRTTYYYYVKSTDSDGNTGVDKNKLNYYTLTTSYDQKPPVISDIQTPVITESAVVVLWKTDELSDSQVLYGTASSTFTKSTPVDQNMSIVHAVTLTGLTTATPYYFVVRSNDPAGNQTTSAQQTTETAKAQEVKIVTVGGGSGNTNNPPPEVKDTTPPVISNITVATTTAFGATITFETNEPTVTALNYGKTTAYDRSEASLSWTRTYSIPLTGLRLGTAYHFQIKAIDKGGNESFSDDQTFTTKFITDQSDQLKTIENVQQYEQELQQSIESILPSILPPFVGDATVSNITEDSAIVSWRTNINTYSTVDYAPDADFLAATSTASPYVSEVSDITTKTRDHNLVLIGLKPNTTYHLKTKSFSVPQVVGEGKDITFTTKAPNVSASIIDVKNTSFRVLWSTLQPASTIVEYKNVKTGITERIIDDKQATYHDILVDKASPATTYEIRVFGYTAAGNLIESGAPLTVLTSRDITPPKISNFKVDGALIPGRTDRVQTVITWITDEPSNSAIFYQEGAGEVKQFANKVDQLDTYTTNHAIILSNLKPGTIYQMKVESTDQAGNKAVFGPRTVITPQKGESIFDVIFKNFEDTFKFLRSAGQ